MKPYEIIILVAWLILAAFILFGVFTRKGRYFNVKTYYRAKSVKDLGEIGKNGLLLGYQTLRLLKCEGNDGRFYIIETKRVFGPSIRYNYTKLDDKAISTLTSLLRSGAHEQE